MARQDRFYIGYLDDNATLQTSMKPFAIPDNAFSQMNNAYIFRGRIRKRFGSKLMSSNSVPSIGYEQLQSRLRIKLPATDGVGNAAGNVAGATFAIGQMFSIGNTIYTVYQSGALLTTSAGTGTYNTATGAYTFTGALALTDIYFYPATSVMALATYQNSAINAEDTIAFDTQFAYKYTTTGWDQLGSAVWTGSDSKFFWTTNWNGLTSDKTFLFVTNYNFSTTLTGSDPMRFWDGTTWTDFQPGFTSTTATNTILTARIIVPFKDRLLLLNVVENTGVAPGVNATYANRCRFSWNGSPTDSTAFYEDVPGKGGYIDAPIKEAIITAQFLKDRLIVYFESSTWELAYTGNQILPFVWQQINTELGAESTFSQISFDKYVLGVGNVGIHACNGSNVDRIDDKIPDSVFEIHNDNNGIERVAGIRDYYTEMVYWSFPSSSADTNYPFNNRVLTYNYKSGSWGFNDDAITAFGYFQTNISGSSTGVLWSEANMTWEEAGFPWRSAVLQSKFNNVIAGNQQGFVFIISPEIYVNTQSLQISNITTTGLVSATITCVNHSLEVGQYVNIENCQGLTYLNDKIFKVIDRNPSDFTIALRDITGSGVYTGGGTIRRVTPIDIYTKQYNFYAQQGRNAAISKVDFLVDRTSNGQCTVDYFASSSDVSLIGGGKSTGSLLGTSALDTKPYTLIPQESNQDRLWHPIYTFVDGEYVQLRLYLTDEQVFDPLVANSEFELHAIVINAQPTSSRLQ